MNETSCYKEDRCMYDPRCDNWINCADIAFYTKASARCQTANFLKRTYQMSKIDELIAKYADKLRQIYDNRTVGDYTFNGLLSEFAHEIEEVEENDR